MTEESKIEQELQNLYGEMETLYGKPAILDEFDQHLKQTIASDPDRSRVLSLAKQTNTMPLQMVFPVEEFLESRLSYLSSGSFGSVMVHQRGRRRQPQAVKVITCLPSGMALQMQGSGMKYRDVYREAQCLLTLGSLVTGVRRSVKTTDDKGETETDNSSATTSPPAATSTSYVRYKAGCFPQLYAIHLVDPTQALMSLEAFFACTPGVASYPLFEKALLLMEHCGSSLHGKLMEPTFVAEQAVSVAKQVILGLVTAEQAFGFEHRDLHVSNLMVATARGRTATFQIGETRYSLPTYGAQAKIIDFSYARLKTADGETLYKNLDSLFEGEDGQGEQQGTTEGPPKEAKTKKDHFDGYRDMFIARGGGGADSWEHYSPRSNLAWVKRFFSEMLQLMAYTAKEMATSAAALSASSSSTSTTADDWARLMARAEDARKYMAKLLELATRSQTTEHFLEQMLISQGDAEQQPVLVPITVKGSGTK